MQSKLTMCCLALVTMLLLFIEGSNGSHSLLQRRSISWNDSPLRHVSHARRDAALPSEEPPNEGDLTITKRGRKHHGKASYYGAGPEACGGSNSSNDYIAALSPELFGDGEHCGKKVRVTSLHNGKKRRVTVTIRDKCPTCDKYKLDLSERAFTSLANAEKGIIQVTWFFLD